MKYFPILVLAVISTSSVQAEVVGEPYRERYRLSDATQKLVDNRGNGFESLYGTRNFRAVLNGVYYRGGGNNYYHRTNKRNNSNPLPNDGLENLCQEGFTNAVYLYSTRYETAPKLTRCKTRDSLENTLSYRQISALSYKREDLKQLLGLIHSHIRDSRLGPIYEHCWNGWHASGYVAASALQQFCGFTKEQAVNYWNINTDGHNGASYENVRRNIRAFVPFDELQISAEEKAAICPNPETLKY